MSGAHALERPNMKDELFGVLIEPNFYCVLKEYGEAAARFKSGKYKSAQAHAMWIAYLCGKEQLSAQQIMERYPDDETQPHEQLL